MAFNTNVTVKGNTTSEPQLKGEGNAYRLLVGVAVNEPRKNGEDKTSFLNVVFFGRGENNVAQVDNVYESIKAKGTPVIVAGALETYQREVFGEDGADGDGFNINVVTVNADDIALNPRFGGVSYAKPQRAARVVDPYEEEAPAPRKRRARAQESESADEVEEAPRKRAAAKKPARQAPANEYDDAGDDEL